MSHVTSCTSCLSRQSRPLFPLTYILVNVPCHQLHELYKRSQPPTSVPPEIAVTLLEEDGNTTSLNLVATKTSFRMNDTELKYDNIRYVTTNCRALCSDAEIDRFVILMSTRRVVQEDAYNGNIVNLFIRPDSAGSALAVLNFLQYHIFQFLK